MVDSPTMRRRLLFAGLPFSLVEDCHRLLCGRYDIERCTADECSLLAGVALLQPNVVIVDLLHLGSLKTIGRITANNPSCLVLALTGMSQISMRESVLAAGGSGVISRSVTATALSQEIDAMLSGRPYTPCIHPEVESDSPDSPQGPAVRLTDSDRLVLGLVARSYPAHRIARALGLPIGAVRLSLAYLKRQFKVRTQLELKRYAGSQHLISDIP